MKASINEVRIQSSAYFDNENHVFFHCIIVYNCYLILFEYLIHTTKLFPFFHIKEL